MMTMILRNWRAGFILFALATMGVLFYQWKSTQAEMNLKVSQMNQIVLQLNGTISQNEAEIRKLAEINAEASRAVHAAEIAREINAESVRTVSSKVDKVTKIETKARESAAAIPDEKVLSQESVSVLASLVLEMEPLVEGLEENEREMENV